MLEHGAYTLLIDSCYDRERFPTLDDALDWTWARTDEEVEAVKFVLSKFFTLEGELYVQSRIQEELSAYHALSETNSRIAKEREEKRRKRKRSEHEACTNSEPIVNEAPPNQEPLTINHKPLTSNINTDVSNSDKPKRFNFKSELLKLNCDEKLVDAFMAVRKTKKATNSEKALELFVGKVNESGMPLDKVLEICIEKDWKGFDVTWLKNQNQSFGQQPQNTRMQEIEQLSQQWELNNESTYQPY